MQKSTSWKMRVSKGDWYRMGGFANSDCFRKATKTGAWTYWVIVRKVG